MDCSKVERGRLGLAECATFVLIIVERKLCKNLMPNIVTLIINISRLGSRNVRKVCAE